jgi:hypothetical protein
MVRWLVIGGVAVVALTVYALVDLFVTQAGRVRAFPKPAWIAVIVALPVLGPILWLFVGKNRRVTRYTRPMFPDDDMGFLGRIDRESAEDRIRRLEEELRQLDEEDISPPASDDDSSTPDTTGAAGDAGEDKTSDPGDDDEGDDGLTGGAGSSAPRS